MKAFYFIGSLAVAAGILAAVASPVFAFEDELEDLLEDNGKNYIQPIVNSLSIDLNSGFYHTAEVHGMFGFDVGVKAMSIFVPEDDKTFEFSFPEPVSVSVGGESITVDLAACSADPDVPTVVGDRDGVNPLDADLTEQAIEDALLAEGLTQDDIDDLQTEISTVVNEVMAMVPDIQGLGLDLVPLAFPQFSLGVGMGTELMLRYIPPVTLAESVEVALVGFGAKHSISQYIPLCPVDLALQIAYQKLNVSDIVESNHLNANFQVSRDFPCITLYGGLGYDRSSMELTYTYNQGEADEEEVVYSMDGENGPRMNAGLTLGFIPFTRISVDYTLSHYSAITAGLSISFR